MSTTVKEILLVPKDLAELKEFLSKLSIEDLRISASPPSSRQI